MKLWYGIFYYHYQYSTGLDVFDIITHKTTYKIIKLILHHFLHIDIF